MKYICRIGNNAQNDLVISDRTSSDFHAQLIMDAEDRVWIKDLSTKYGTRVNGLKISKQELVYTDELRIGFNVIDWISIRNNWLAEQNIQIENHNWSEPLEKESSFGKTSNKISSKLAEEAGQERKEYNREEMTDNASFKPLVIHLKQNSEMIIDSSHTIENASSSQADMHLTIESESSEIPISTSESPINLSDESEKAAEKTELKRHIETPELINPEVSIISNEILETKAFEDQVVVGKQNELTQTHSALDTNNDKQPIEQEVLNNSSDTDGKEQELGDSSVIEQKPAGIDFTSEHQDDTKKQPIGEARIVAKTSVENFESTRKKPLISKDQKLILIVIPITAAMIAAGWLLAYFGNS